jgi:hypothetical protein
MIVRVESCWGGHSIYWRLIMPDGSRETLTNPQEERWSRKHAARAKDMISPNYGIPRHKIRFDAGKA